MLTTIKYALIIVNMSYGASTGHYDHVENNWLETYDSHIECLDEKRKISNNLWGDFREDYMVICLPTLGSTVENGQEFRKLSE